MVEDRCALTYDDFWDFTIVQDVQVSPDGGLAAYTVGTLDRGADDARVAIWVVDLETRETRAFTAGTKRDTQPRWSPDGRWLAFVSTRAGDKPQVFVMSASGGEARQVTEGEDGAHSPEWSSDSRRLVYVVDTASERQSVQSELAWVDAKSEERKDTPVMRRVTELQYRHDGAGYVDTVPHLFVIDREGGGATQLTDGDFGESEPAWSPDGQHIAFVSNRTADREYNTAADLWLTDVETREMKRLTDGTLSLSSPAWSPDGETIAFYAEPEWIANGTENMHLWAVSREGGDHRDLMAGVDCTMHNLLGDHIGFASFPPRWSPDGRAVYCTNSTRGAEILVRVPVQGGEVTPVWDGDIHVTGASVTPNGSHVICCAASPTKPFDLHRVQASGGGAEQLTNSNRALMENIKVAPAERFSFASVGGWEIEGWLIRPVVNRSGDAPLVLHIHGGPHGMYGTTFYYNMQVLAGAGIACAYINPRGSSGYGIDFTRAVMADWGGRDYQDLMNGVDHVLKMGGIDAGRLACTGGSYGGFMTCWILGHTDRFAAGVSVNPVTNLISFWGTSDIGALWYEKQMGGSLFERWEQYRKLSPLTYAPEITTPLLLIHAENDFRCPIEQSEQMFAALKYLRREVEMVRIPGASHGLATTARPRHRVERWRLACEWFVSKF